MAGHLCHAVNKKCYNPWDTYGEICIHCGCCSKDVAKRQQARLALHKRLLKDDAERLKGYLKAKKTGPRAYKKYGASFKWIDDQIKNAAANVSWNKKRIKYYEIAIAKRKAREKGVKK